jgi:two-component system LytT family response regulator
MKIRALIADDEAPALAKLRKSLATSSQVEIVGEAGDGLSAASMIRELRPDVAFLDIRMPGNDGLSAVNGLSDPPLIVFVTAYSEHAASAFACRAVDYLLKPYGPARISEVLGRVQERLRMQRLAEWVRGESQIAPQPAPLETNRLVLKLGSELQFVPLTDIECAIAEGNYLHVMTIARKFFVRGVLAALDAIVEEHAFLRVHRSATVNLRRIRALSLDNRELFTTSGFRVPISRSRLSSLLQAIDALGLPTLGDRTDS